MERRVVIIEVERAASHALDAELRAAGAIVTLAHTAADGLAAVRGQSPDVVIVSLALPDRGGDEVCRAIRAEPAIAGVGVIAIGCARGGEDDVLGLAIGADDCALAGAEPVEVARRVAALCGALAERRASTAASPGADDAGALRAGPIELDPATGAVRVQGVPTALRPLAFRLLHLLLAEPGRVFSRGELLAEIWDLGADADSAGLDAHVRRLRTSLGPAADIVESVDGFGYRVVGAAP